MEKVLQFYCLIPLKNSLLFSQMTFQQTENIYIGINRI